MEVHSQAHETNDADFSYKEISIVSDATEDVVAESIGEMSEVDELGDFQTLLEGTQRKMEI